MQSLKKKSPIENPRGLGACNDELMAWVNNFNRYAKGSAEHFWLSNHSGTFTDNLRSDKYTVRCMISMRNRIFLKKKPF
jgi:hypothetical protein